ncbi:MAG: M48 family metallopeptidase [Gammaproteobacteria bacterium]|nr:M48 family metallopeptidase [Gammaproteobacteria bacterium]
MNCALQADDYRLADEKQTLYWGFGIFSVILFFFAADWWLATVFLVLIAAAMVWIRQSQLLGNAVLVSERQFPDLHRLATEAAVRLNMPKPPVFITQDPTLNAFALGFLGRQSVVLHSATVEAMSPAEIQYIIGHEFSHIKCGHTNVLVLTNSTQGLNIPFLSQLLQFLFLGWSRKAEYTCDRGGLLANRDPRAAICALSKLAVGNNLFHQLDIEDFVNDQRTALDTNALTRLSENLVTHPYLVKRLQALSDFFRSNTYHTLTETA